MSTRNKGFNEEISKTIPQYHQISSNTHLCVLFCRTCDQSFTGGLDPDNREDDRREAGYGDDSPTVEDPVEVDTRLKYYQTQRDY